MRKIPSPSLIARPAGRVAIEEEGRVRPWGDGGGLVGFNKTPCLVSSSLEADRDGSQSASGVFAGCADAS